MENVSIINKPKQTWGAVTWNIDHIDAAAACSQQELHGQHVAPLTANGVSGSAVIGRVFCHCATVQVQVWGLLKQEVLVVALLTPGVANASALWATTAHRHRLAPTRRPFHQRGHCPQPRLRHWDWHRHAVWSRSWWCDSKHAGESLWSVYLQW